MAWDPAQYDLFRDERSAPFLDLLALSQLSPGLRIVDLGCGTGELTARLAALSPGSQVLGIDSSPAMLAQAQPRSRDGLRFQQQSIEAFVDAPRPPRPEPAHTDADPAGWDLIFSHAALQWIDDHPTLFARLLDRLSPGGLLLVQMPSNHDHLSHALVREVAASEPFVSLLGGAQRRSPVLPISAYAELLFRLGIPRPTVLEKVYPHVLPDAQAVLQWVRGTLLVPFFERLPPEHHPAFLAALSQRFADAMPDRPYFYGFRRILIAAQRSAA
jgi:trans-aconitate 2-methyltransferase